MFVQYFAGIAILCYEFLLPAYFQKQKISPSFDILM